MVSAFGFQNSKSNDMDFMSFLPTEIVNLIFEKLPAADLIACSSCNKSWRQAVNYDKLWYKICEENNWTDGREKTSCQTLRNSLYVKGPCSKSHLQTPVGTSLDPLCEWRLYYSECLLMRERWRSGKCVLSDIPDSDSAFQDEIEFFGCDGELLVVGDMRGRVVLWNITCDPAVIVHSTPDDADLTYVHLHQKHLLIEYGKLLRVHKITNLSETTAIYELDMESYLGYPGPEKFKPLLNRVMSITGGLFLGEDEEEEEEYIKEEFYLTFQDDLMALSGCLINHVDIFRVSTGEHIQSFTMPGSLFCIGQLLFFDKELYVPAFNDLGENIGCVLATNIKDCSWKRVGELSEIPSQLFVNEKMIVAFPHLLGVLPTFNLHVWKRQDGEKIPSNWWMRTMWVNLPLHGTKMAFRRNESQILICDTAGERNIRTLGKNPEIRTFCNVMSKGRENLLVTDLDGKSVQVWDMDTGAYLYGLNVYGQGTLNIYKLWADASKIIVVPFVCKPENTIVLIDYRFNSA